MIKIFNLSLIALTQIIIHILSCITQSMAQGFPTLGKQLKIVNKLNNMAITISQGWHNTKPGVAIVDRPDFPHAQTFKVTQKGNSDVYIIQTPLSDNTLSTRSAWGDMIYSEVKFDKYSMQVSQLWRMIPYDGVMYNQKQKQHVPVTTNQGGCKCGSQSKSQQHVLKLGYEFESGYHLNYEYKNGQKVSHKQTIINQFDVPNPVRTLIKQKNNRHPIDKDNKGWFFIENVKYNLVLQIQGGIDEPGMNIVLNKLYGNRNQLWKFV